MQNDSATIAPIVPRAQNVQDPLAAPAVTPPPVAPAPAPDIVASPTPIAPPPAPMTNAPTPTAPVTTEKPEVRVREPKLDFLETQDILKKMEERMQTRVLCYYTPKDTSINQNHPDIFLEQLRNIGPQETITLVLISNGGDSSASLRIATIIRDYCKNLNIIIPSRCASAATVLALSGDRIIMCPAGYLTAIDTSLNHELNPKGADGKPVWISVDQIKRVLKFLNEEGPSVNDGHSEGAYRTLFRYVHPVTIGEIDRVASRSILVATKMMNLHAQSFKDQEQITWIANHLYNDYPEHGFPILFQEAKDIGLPVEKADLEMSDLLRDLVNYYDVTTKGESTHFSESHYHSVAYTNLVESVGMRTVYRSTYERRLNPITKTWQTENDFSRWINLIPPQKPGEKITIRPLDIPGGTQ